MEARGHAAPVVQSEFQIGDRVRPKHGVPDEDRAVIVRCQPVCVDRVQVKEGTISYYSGQERVRIGAGNERKRGNPALFTEERREVCN